MKRSILVALALASSIAHAVEWTQQVGSYNWYLYGTQNKYLPVNPVDIKIPDSYVLQPGVYIQCLSDGGSKRYLPQGYDCNTRQLVTVKCDAIICKDSFGITFNAHVNTVMQCPMIKISNAQILLYDAAQSVNNVPTCPK